MRLALTVRSGRRAGGVETYVERVLPLLAAAGHELALFVEHEGASDRAALEVPPGVERRPLGAAAEARAPLEAWRPDLVYAHGIEDPALEAAMLQVAPVVTFVHDYHGTCVSGTKTHRWPTPRPCGRRFGPACLALFHVRRCGGLDPRTMLREYRRQARRLEVLRRSARLLVFSEHMRRELLAHGAAPARVIKLPGLALEPAAPVEDGAPAPDGRVRLAFVGRMEPLKGGAQLISAAALAARRLGRRVELTFAGEGNARARWEEAARRESGVEARFAGWLGSEALGSLLRRVDLLAVPSVWPEPFGLVGIEAGLLGVPSVAYRVGGVEEWLQEGVGGALAPGDPPTIDGLADAIVRCVERPDVLARLREGARTAARAHSPTRHLEALSRALDAARAGGGERRGAR